MSDGSDVIYLYDGSFNGLMCCVFDSFRRRERPTDIQPYEQTQQTLYDVHVVETDEIKAERVINGIDAKLGASVLRFVKKAFLTCLDGKECAILDFIKKAFAEGRMLLSRLTDPTVEPLAKAIRHMDGEAELLKGFVRFSDFGGVLVSVIEPKNQVLPLIAGHFADRYPDETLMIYDKGRGEFLLCEKGKRRLGYTDSFIPAPADADEKNYRALWQSFYETIAIKERYNPVCRQTHMPKRYWANMTEFWERETYLPLNAKSEGRELAQNAGITEARIRQE